MFSDKYHIARGLISYINNPLPALQKYCVFFGATYLCLKTSQLRLKILYLPLQGDYLSTNSLRLYMRARCCLGEYVFPRWVLVEVVYLVWEKVVALI